MKALLTPQEIKQAIKDAHQRKPRVILSAMEIYEAIAKAQYDKDQEDIKLVAALLPE